jgi:hypothetical protein
MSARTIGRSRVASLSRSRTPDDPELVDARRELAVANLENYVARVIDAAPPLTQQQRDRIASLIQPAGRG